jgi:predicted dithiol-disulfide oxidoreductase (DUF899 family)
VLASLLGRSRAPLDLTARGRQEDWEQPPGRSDGPLLTWLRHHDSYDA